MRIPGTTETIDVVEVSKPVSRKMRIFCVVEHFRRRFRRTRSDRNIVSDTGLLLHWEALVLNRQMVLVKSSNSVKCLA